MGRSYPFTQPDFNWQQLRQLAGEDADFEAELLAIFLSDVESSLRQLEGAIAAQNIQNIVDIAHSLRGASINVGATALAQVAQQLEQIAGSGTGSGRVTGAQALLQALHSHCQSLRVQSQIRQ